MTVTPLFVSEVAQMLRKRGAILVFGVPKQQQSSSDAQSDRASAFGVHSCARVSGEIWLLIPALLLSVGNRLWSKPPVVFYPCIRLRTRDTR